MTRDDPHRPESALRLLYQGVAALQSEDHRRACALAEAALATGGLAVLVSTVAMCVGEQLRDRAADRSLEPAALAGWLHQAHQAAAAEADVRTALIAGAWAHLDGRAPFGAEELCQLARDPRSTAHAAVQVLHAALVWTARDRHLEPAWLCTQAEFAAVTRAELACV